MARTPVKDAPMARLIDASSSSACITTPPRAGRLRTSKFITSVAGVIGYPAKKRPPAAMNPIAAAWLPDMKILSSSVSRDGNVRMELLPLIPALSA